MQSRPAPREQWRTLQQRARVPWGPRPELADRSVLLLAEDMAARRVLSDGCHFTVLSLQIVSVSANLLRGAAVTSQLAAPVGNLKGISPFARISLPFLHVHVMHLSCTYAQSSCSCQATADDQKKLSEGAGQTSCGAPASCTRVKAANEMQYTI